jgi:nitrous oxidase accessory protein NosD
VEDCEMQGNDIVGVHVMGAATRVTLRRCIARDGKSVGYHFLDGAGGVMERCEAVGNAFTGVSITTGADPMLRDCIIRDNQLAGVLVVEAGRGRLQGCEIAANGYHGVGILAGGAPEMTGCTISRNGLEAIFIGDAASGGTFRGNDLRGNASVAWYVAEGAQVERVDNRE